ncbi:MAG TPA: hypothetical protein VJT16_19575 [Streptosporangiaceae bacterium]|jgi:hypothetical protein|nr:hypothetical protein [Streptosporangiaceae bacterium]
MGLLSLPFRLPLLPVTALVHLAELLEREAERQLDAEAWRQLEDAEEARLSGQATDEEIAFLEEQALQRLTGWRAYADQPSEEQVSDG